jgi:hypothetical protein
MPGLVLDLKNIKNGNKTKQREIVIEIKDFKLK